MRIAQIAPLWTPVPPIQYGGIELVLGLLCAGLFAKGHQVTLFASGDSTADAQVEAIIPKNLNALMGDSAAFVAEYYLNAALADALRAQDAFDVFHVHLPLALLPFAQLSRKPCLFTLHTSPHVDDFWMLQRYPNAAVNGISHAQCSPIAGQLQRQLPVVPNAIDFGIYTPSFAPGKYLAFLGRMSPEKNPVGAIGLAKAAGLPIVLGGVAQTHQEVAYFETEVRPLLDGERVRWLGLVNHAEKVALLQNAAALLFPITWDEPFGLVMIEAMACGTPVLAIQRGSVPEVVQPGVTGCTGATLPELSALLPATLALDRANVRRAAEAQFGCDQMVEEYLKLYKNLTAASRQEIAD